MANANTVTYSGRSIIWNRLKGSGTEPKNIQWGDTTVTASANPDVNLFKPQTEARTVGTSTLVTTTQLADTYQVVGTITCAVGAKTITEAGLFDTSTVSPTTTVTNSLTNSGTTLTVGSTTGLPAVSYYMQLENEIVLVTSTTSSTLTVTRGRLGSTSATHAAGAVLTLGGDGGAGTGGATSEQTATVAAAQGGNLFCHADFAGIALAVNDSINFTFKDQLT